MGVAELSRLRVPSVVRSEIVTVRRKSLRLVVRVVLSVEMVDLLKWCAGALYLAVLPTLLLDGRLQLHVGLLLDRLSSLQLLDQLHLEHLHLHYLLLCLCDRLQLLFNLVLDLHAGVLDFPAFLLVDLLACNLLLHLNRLLFILVFLLNDLDLGREAVLVLLGLHFGLTGFLGL